MGGGKADAKKARHWQGLLGEAARSGISIREFCRRKRVKESQFYWWQRRLRLVQQVGAGSHRSGGNGQAASFALVSEEGGAIDAGIELVLSGGRRLRITKGFVGFLGAELLQPHRRRRGKNSIADSADLYRGPVGQVRGFSSLRTGSPARCL